MPSYAIVKKTETYQIELPDNLKNDFDLASEYAEDRVASDGGLCPESTKVELEEIVK